MNHGKGWIEKNEESRGFFFLSRRLHFLSFFVFLPSILLFFIPCRPLKFLSFHHRQQYQRPTQVYEGLKLLVTHHKMAAAQEEYALYYAEQNAKNKMAWVPTTDAQVPIDKNKLEQDMRRSLYFQRGLNETEHDLICFF